MKRIEFIAPVEAMRGNLSGTQKGLEYPTQDNAAYESPVGSRNYAKNYSPKFIGAKRAADGLKYFAVRTKSAIGMTAASKKQMAVLGGCGAIVAAILRDKTADIFTNVELAWEYAKSKGEKRSLRKFLSDQVMANLRAKNPAVFVGQKNSTTLIYVNNPWHSTGAGQGANYFDVSVTTASLVKFWGELAQNGITYHIENIGDGIAYSGNKFVDVVDNQKLNVLGLTSEDIGGSTYIKSGERYILMVNVSDPTEMQFVQDSDLIIASGSDEYAYEVTSNEP